jgi:hypothetical protein
MIPREDALLETARRYCEATGLALATVSTRAVNDGKCLGRVANGGQITQNNFLRGMRWFSDHWPGEVEWPGDIERPERERAA